MKAWLVLPLFAACTTSDPNDPPPPACGTPTLSDQLAVTQNEVLSLALAGGQLYWLDMGGVGEVSTDASGSGLEIVQSSSGAAFALGGTIATNGSMVYWADGDFPSGTVDSVPAGGGTRTMIAQTDEPLGVAIDATNIYWSTFGSSDDAVGTIVKQPLAGGAPTVLASGLSTVGAIAIDDTNVYWTDMFGAVASVPIAGGTVKTLVPAQYALPPNTILDDSPVGIAVIDGTVYWASTPLDGSSPSTIDSVSIDGGTPAVIATPATTPRGIAVDDQFVYWSEIGVVTEGSGLGTPPTADQGTVSRVDRGAGGTPQVLATGASYPTAPVVANNALYYASGSSASTIFRIVM
ncbi:MAG TPA: hypothetical protein VGL61_08720 [Kofleriaceae bacterium]|jgi:type II secretory pathway pseudopilin PulG